MSTNSKPSAGPFILAAAAAIAALGGLYIAGVIPHLKGAETAGGNHIEEARLPGCLIAVVDRTGSTVDSRQWEIKQLYDMADLAAADDSKVTIWSLDHRPVKLWDDGLPDTAAKNFQTMVLRELSAKWKPAPLPGGRPDSRAQVARAGKLMERVNLGLGERPQTGQRVCLWICTDGADEDSDDAERLNIEARRFLKAHDGAHVIISGVEPDNRRMWETAFAPAGNRLQIGGPGATIGPDSFPRIMAGRI